MIFLRKHLFRILKYSFNVLQSFAKRKNKNSEGFQRKCFFDENDAYPEVGHVFSTKKKGVPSTPFLLLMTIYQLIMKRFELAVVANVG